MKHKITVVVILFFLMPFTITSNPNSSALFQSIKNLFATRGKNRIINGTFLVAHGADGIFNEGFGWADKERKIKNSSKSQYLIGSITKQFTAVAILKLVDQGNIDLHKPISTYLPHHHPIWCGNFQEWANTITIHHLLIHSSGLPEYVRLEGFGDFYKKPRSSKEFITFISDQQLSFEPGSKYEYSGTGYNILGIIIESVTGIDYGSFLAKELFKPLNMKSTYAAHREMLSCVQKIHPELSIGYNLDEQTKELQPGDNVNMTTAFAEASIISNTDDLHAWNLALYAGKIISAKSLELMLTPHLQTNYKNMATGYGVLIYKSPEEFFYKHDGMINGYQSSLLYQPKHKLTIVGLSNALGSNPDELVYKIQDLVNEYLGKQSPGTGKTTLLVAVIAFLIIILFFSMHRRNFFK
ncbi:MAG TPA: serine hydrolase domain-containing protein [Candidatus Babeliales bacterium]|nr:serine hydrolase domain-containing protein [Candidatus Babeliales bacterium]